MSAPKITTLGCRLNAYESEAMREMAEAAGLIWRTDRGGAYMSTPVVVGDSSITATSSGNTRAIESMDLIADLVASDHIGGRRGANFVTHEPLP